MKKDLTIENINNSKKLGVALRRFRKLQGLGQTELAKSMGMRQATISEVENGKGSLESFFKILQGLKVNLVLSNRQGLKGKGHKNDGDDLLELLEDE